jgi:hypothetical protein
MRRLTPHSDSRLQAWFPQADGEVLLAERKTTRTLELLRLLRPLLLTIPSVPITACPSVQPSHPDPACTPWLSPPHREPSMPIAASLPAV